MTTEIQHSFIISLEEARACYPPNQCPTDETLRKLIKFFTWAAESEYDQLIEEEKYAPNR